MYVPVHCMYHNLSASQCAEIIFLFVAFDKNTDMHENGFPRKEAKAQRERDRETRRVVAKRKSEIVKYIFISSLLYSSCIQLR